MALFNYHVIQVNTGVWCVERVGMKRNTPLLHWSDQQQAEQIARTLVLETNVMADTARNECLLDVRGHILHGIRNWGVPALTALPHVAAAKKPEDVAISTTIKEAAAALDELKDLRAKIHLLEEDLRVTNALYEECRRVLAAIPPCPEHGECVPHALEWIERAKVQMEVLESYQTDDE